jgi:hypothetical protein
LKGHTVNEANIPICACSSPHFFITFLNNGVSTMLGDTLKIVRECQSTKCGKVLGSRMVI